MGKGGEGLRMHRLARGVRVAALVVGASGLAACLPLARRPLVDSYTPLEAIDAPVRSSGLRARFLGTSTIVLTDGETTIMTDGFLSRPSLGRLALLPVKPNRIRIERALLKGKTTKVAAIFVAQSHHDHAMDTPYVAQLTGATIVGSESTRNIAIGVDFPSGRIETIEHGSTCRFGDFTVTVYKTPHSSPMPFPGTIRRPLSRYAWVEEYREGGNFSYFIHHPLGRILIIPSRGEMGERFKFPDAETVFLGIGGLASHDDLKRYWGKAVGKSTKHVYPIHWDNFFRPLDAQNGLKPFYRRGFEARMDLLEQLGGESVEVTAPSIVEPIDLAQGDAVREIAGPATGNRQSTGCRNPTVPKERSRPPT